MNITTMLTIRKLFFQINISVADAHNFWSVVKHLCSFDDVNKQSTRNTRLKFGT